MQPPFQFANVPVCPHCKWPLALRETPGFQGAWGSITPPPGPTYSWICTHCQQGAVVVQPGTTQLPPRPGTGSVTGLPPGTKITGIQYGNTGVGHSWVWSGDDDADAAGVPAL